MKKRGLRTNGVYKFCRNPMQFGMMLMLIGYHIMTWDRLWFILINFIGIFIGVYFE
jgi:protein-S-isoprenylcysteine O-methyltransferase Ste14